MICLHLEETPMPSEAAWPGEQQADLEPGYPGLTRVSHVLAMALDTVPHGALSQGGSA